MTNGTRSSRTLVTYSFPLNVLIEISVMVDEANTFRPVFGLWSMIPSIQDPQSPSGRRYDIGNRATMLLHAHDFFALAHAIRGVANKTINEYSKWSDSSKAQYATVQAKKLLKIVRYVDRTGQRPEGVLVSLYLQPVGGQNLSISTVMDIPDALAFADVLEEMGRKAILEYFDRKAFRMQQVITETSYSQTNVLTGAPQYTQPVSQPATPPPPPTNPAPPSVESPIDHSPSPGIDPVRSEAPSPPPTISDPQEIITTVKNRVEQMTTNTDDPQFQDVKL